MWQLVLLLLAPAPLVTAVDGQRYTVDGAQIAATFGALENLQRRHGRMIPHYKEGQVIGIKLVGVRGRSGLRALGLRSGFGDDWLRIGTTQLLTLAKQL